MVKKPKFPIAGLRRILASNRFFYFIVGLFAVQALWIAYSARYAMAFDEDFHLGIIKLYAGHQSPFWQGHPAGADAYGAVARDPSYLYHFLMSLPYRFITLVTNNFATHVVWLRMVNIGLFASGLWLYRRLLLKTGAGQALVHSCLLLFVLIPIVPMLAAQINYDNLVLPLTALTLLMAIEFISRLKKNFLDLRLLLGLLIVSLLASLVKYAFLPAFLGIVAFLIFQLYNFYDSRKQFKKAVLKGWQRLGKKSAIGLILLLLLSGGMFAERYGINIWRYHTPIADCGEVLSYNQCRNYGPWIRDYNFSKNKVNTATNPLAYSQHWIYGMWFRTVFAVDGPASNYETRGPLLMPALTLAFIAIAALLAFVLQVRQVFKVANSTVLWLFCVVIVIHVLAVWQEQYRLFLETHQPVAVNGRYLLPVMPLIMIIGALSLKQILIRHPRLQTILLLVTILGFIWGGGAMTYVLRSSDRWYWDNSPLTAANNALQRTLGPVTPGYNNPLLYLH